jgi:hypothetical protein
MCTLPTYVACRTYVGSVATAITQSLLLQDSSEDNTRVRCIDLECFFLEATFVVNSSEGVLPHSTRLSMWVQCAFCHKAVRFEHVDTLPKLNHAQQTREGPLWAVLCLHADSVVVHGPETVSICHILRLHDRGVRISGLLTAARASVTTDWSSEMALLYSAGCSCGV